MISEASATAAAGDGCRVARPVAAAGAFLKTMMDEEPWCRPFDGPLRRLAGRRQLNDTPAAAAEMRRRLRLLELRTACCEFRPLTPAPGATSSTRPWPIRWRRRRSAGSMPGSRRPVALYDPDGIADALIAMYPTAVDSLFVHDVSAVGQSRGGLAARPLTEIWRQRQPHRADCRVRRRQDRRAHRAPGASGRRGGHAGRSPPAGRDCSSIRARYLDKLNFATNFAFFREADGLSTRLVSANYWAGYGATEFGCGCACSTPRAPCWRLGSRSCHRVREASRSTAVEVRDRFGLPPFTGQLFIHAIGVAGHDVVKYALDTFRASDNGASLSCTHDANAWPSDRFAGLPAPRPDERVVLWLQNSHAVPIPAGTIALDRMGAEQPVMLDQHGRSVRHRRAGRRRLFARPALARADRTARRPPRGAAAL